MLSADIDPVVLIFIMGDGDSVVRHRQVSELIRAAFGAGSSQHLMVTGVGRPPRCTDFYSFVTFGYFKFDRCSLSDSAVTDR